MPRRSWRAAGAITTVLLMSAFGAPAAHAAAPHLLLVCPTGPNDHPDTTGPRLACPAGAYASIQAAVNAARAGDWILVAPGDYHEQGSAKQGVCVTTPCFIAAAFVLALSFVYLRDQPHPRRGGPFEGLLTVLMIANGVPVAAGAAAGLLLRGFSDILMAGVGAVFLVLIRKGRVHERPRLRGRSTSKPATRVKTATRSP
jgi:hypothetical protein